MEHHKPLPVAGYRPQNSAAVALVNEHKIMEERMLRHLDEIKMYDVPIDGRWLAIGRTHLEQAFMAINRAVFQPARAVLPGDKPKNQE